MFDEEKLRQNLETILKKPRYTTLSTGKRNQLIKELIDAAKSCEIHELTLKEATNSPSLGAT